MPLGDAPAVLAREEGDIFALLSEPTILRAPFPGLPPRFVRLTKARTAARARQCAFPPSPSISVDGVSISVTNYALEGPVLSSSAAPSPISLAPSDGWRLIGRSDARQ